MNRAAERKVPQLSWTEAISGCIWTIVHRWCDEEGSWTVVNGSCCEVGSLTVANWAAERKVHELVSVVNRVPELSWTEAAVMKVPVLLWTETAVRKGTRTIVNRGCSMERYLSCCEQRLKWGRVLHLLWTKMVPELHAVNRGCREDGYLNCCEQKLQWGRVPNLLWTEAGVTTVLELLRNRSKEGTELLWKKLLLGR